MYPVLYPDMYPNRVLRVHVLLYPTFHKYDYSPLVKYKDYLPLT